MKQSKHRFKYVTSWLMSGVILALFVTISGVTGLTTLSWAALPPTEGGTLESRDISPEKRSEIISHLNVLQLPFIANQGQVDKNVRFYAKTFGGTFFVTNKGELVYSLSKLEEGDVTSLSVVDKPSLPVGDSKSSSLPVDRMPKDSPFPPAMEGLGKGKTKVLGLAIKEELIGATLSGVKGEEEAATRVSYFKGSDTSKWKSGIPTYESVSLGEVYKGIELNLKAYGNNVEKLFNVNPGANPADIKVKINGANGIRVNEDGELEVSTELGTVKFTKPVAYQEKVALETPYPLAEEGRGEGEREFVEVAYVVEGNSYSFKLGNYDKTMLLIIDPLLASTFVGGGDNDYTGAIDIDMSGNVYVAGSTYSTNYTTIAGAYDTSHNGSWDVIVFSLSGDLSTLLASTFIGGSGGDSASSLAIDSSGTVYVTGTTGSSNYPTTAGSYDISFNGGRYSITDSFVSMLSSDLSTLLASTFIGGSGDDSAAFLVVDVSGNVYVTGYTDSSGYPTTSGAFDTSFNYSVYGSDYGDGFVSKLNSNLSALLGSTFLGGDHLDFPSSLALDTSGNLYVIGCTKSRNYPTTTDAYDTSINETGDYAFYNCDGIISKLNNNLSTLLASTFIGGNSWDEAESIAIDAWGDVYVTGNTESSGYPTTAGAYDRSYSGPYGYSDAFISKLNSNLSTLLASTFLGGGWWDSTNEGTFSIAIDISGNVYVTGYTTDYSYPTTAYAYDTSYNGQSDVFVSRLSSDLSTLLASTFIGGNSGDVAVSIAIDTAGSVYVAGRSGSTDFPTTVGSYDTSYNSGSWDVFVSKLDANLSAFLPDTDGDGTPDAMDNCPSAANADQTDTDGDDMGDACDADDDNDGYSDTTEVAAGSDPLNTASIPLPDLAISYLVSITTILEPGQSFDLSNTVANQGYSWAYSYTVEFHLSTNTIYGDGDDIIFTTIRSETSLGPGSHSTTTTLTIPSTTSLGAYYICAMADNGGTVSESNETNNTLCTTSSINIGVGYVSRASGISTRGKVETGTNIMVGGFTIVGTESKKVLLRGRGPSMSGAPYNFTGTLTNPTLEIYSGATLFATVDDWQSGATMCNAPAVSCGTPSELQAALADPCQPNSGQTTAPPGCNLEAAMYITLPPGAYTAKLKGVNSEIGKGIVEVYDPDMTTLTNMGGISTRGKVLTGTDIMVGGFIISGGTSSKKVLLRGRGPSMSGAPYNFTGTLTNPTLEIYSGATLFASVDDWQSGAAMCNAPAISCGTPAELETALVDPCQPNAGQTTAPPSCNLESAMMITLPPGAYTAKLKGVNDGTGIGIVEVYEMP
ncbi:MAG: hypothetical protein A2Y53_01810 [Chloroflexi bacterium RBG_16_47_49]|nr:MAG: hypothetical protein A2Y53_01810 [Chloroflexi bacterium RBG_16_47_49]